MPGVFRLRFWFFVLSALNPPTKPGNSPFSSSGKKHRLTIPLGMYMIASFLLGLATLLPAPNTPGMECKKGSATAAPLAFRNFLLEKCVRFNMASMILQKKRLLR